MPACRLGQGVVVVARLAFLAAGQMRRRQLPGQPPIPFRPAGQHQQVRPRRVGLLGAGAVAQRQLGTEHRGHVQFLGGLGETHHPVEPVVIGQRDGPQIQAGGLLDEFLRCAGTVEEAVCRVRVQFGVRDRRTRPPNVRRLVDPALAGPGRAVAAVAVRLGQRRSSPARLAGEHPLHFRPARRPVMPSHRASVSNICSIHCVTYRSSAQTLRCPWPTVIRLISVDLGCCRGSAKAWDR